MAFARTQTCTFWLCGMVIVVSYVTGIRSELNVRKLPDDIALRGVLAHEVLGGLFSSTRSDMEM